MNSSSATRTSLSHVLIGVPLFIQSLNERGDLSPHDQAPRAVLDLGVEKSHCCAVAAIGRSGAIASVIPFGVACRAESRSISSTGQVNT
jgi:hypothetical protein